MGVKAPPRIVHFRNIQPGAGRGQFVLPAVMILIGIVSVQFGAGLADRLFGQVPPAAVTGLRLWTSALAMVVISGRGFARSVRDLKKRRAAADAAIAILFGISLGVMNFSIYQSFARIPLGVAVTIEFLGPLAVAVAGSRHLRDVGWVVLAATGVVLLTQGGHGHLNLAGVLFAGLAATCWAAYIVLSSATGQRFPGSAGLAIAMVVSAVIVTPPALIAGGGAMFRPAVLAIGAAIGILSSVIPYRLELESLRRIPMRLFGVWMSLEPAVAALIGLALLGQHLSAVQWLAICCVMVACAGAAQHQARGTPSVTAGRALYHKGRARRSEVPRGRLDQAGARADAGLDAAARAGRGHRRHGDHVHRCRGAAQRVRARLPGLAAVQRGGRRGQQERRADPAQHLDRVRQQAAELPAGHHRRADLHRGLAVPAESRPAVGATWCGWARPSRSGWWHRR